MWRLAGLPPSSSNSYSLATQRNTAAAICQCFTSLLLLLSEFASTNDDDSDNNDEQQASTPTMTSDDGK